MRRGKLAASSSSTHADRPRAPGPASDLFVAPAAAAAASATFLSPSEDYSDDVSMTHLEEDDMSESEEAGAYVDSAQDDSSDGSDEENCYHFHQLEHHQYPPHNPDPDQYHQPPPGSAFLDAFDGYLSDDQEMEMSGDAGYPLVNYLEVAQLLTTDMDLDPSASSPGGFDIEPDEPGDAPDGTEFSVSETDDHYQPVPPPAYSSLLPHLHAPLHPPLPILPTLPSHLQDFDSDVDSASVAVGFEGTHPVIIANPILTQLEPTNDDLSRFLHHWAGQTHGLTGLPRGRYPWPARINDVSPRALSHRVQYADLNGDQCDLQGIDWDHIGVTRREARERRLLTYRNYVNHQNSDRWTPKLPDEVLPRTDSFFRFRRMDIQRGIKMAHFQLRNLLAAGSRTRIFYPGLETLLQFNPVTGKTQPVMKLNDTNVSSLGADHGVLVAGCFNGEYVIRHLDSDGPESTACHEGVITTNASGITNHLQIHDGRGTSRPLAAFASNDMWFRVLDVATETWLSSEEYKYPLNCTAISPDRRLRVMVGDDLNVIITAAESTLPGNKPEILQSLSGHRDFGFACDWADDGWTVATGFQDMSIKIWDARKWTNSSGASDPVCTLRTEMAGVRSLRFSPIGSGKRVLVAAEEVDYINIIDAQTFRSKQTVDIFGEIGGISFMSEGQDLEVLCCDKTRGGLIHLEKCGEWQEGDWSRNREARRGRGTTYDWERSAFTEKERLRESDLRKHRRRALADDLEPF